MTTTKRSRILTLFMMLSLLFQATAVAQDVGSSPGVDGALNVRLQDTDGTTLDGCVTVLDANGASHHDCTRDAGGWIVFTGLPYGMATVTNVQTEAGYYQAPAQDVVIIENGAPTVTMVSEPVVVAPAMASLSLDEGDGEAEVESDPVVTPEENGAHEDTGEGVGGGDTGEEGNAGGENGEADTDEGEVITPDEGDEDADNEGDEAGADVSNPATLASDGVSIMSIGSPSTQCFAQGNNNGAQVFLYIPYTGGEPETKPVVTYSEVDRFDNHLDPVTVDPEALVWDGSRYTFNYFTGPTVNTINFEIDDEARDEPLFIGAGCANFNPLQLEIETVAVQRDGTVIPNRGHIGSDVEFGDTAEFVGPSAVYASELVGKTVTYTLYDSENNVVYTEDVTVNPDGTIPASGFTTQPDGVYDWHVTFAGTKGDGPEGSDNFAPAASVMGSETVIVGSVATTVRTTMKTAAGDTIRQDGSVAVGTSVKDSTELIGATSDAGGTVTYTLYKGACGEDQTVVHGPERVQVTNGQVPDSEVVENLDQGTYNWVVVYSGDDNNVGDTSECGEETFTVGKASPSITTTMLANGEELNENWLSVAPNTEVSDTAVMTGFHPGAEDNGTVTYVLYFGSCEDGNEVEGGTGTVEVGPNGEIPQGPTVTVTQPGNYFWVVTYSGDANNTDALSPCGDEVFVINKTNIESITTTPQYKIGEDEFQDIPQDGVVRAPATVRDKAVILPAGATGQLTFILSKGDVCGDDIVHEGTVAIDPADGGVVYSGIAEDLEPGQYNWVVKYSGDNVYNPLETPCFEEQFFVTAEDVGIGGYVGTTIKNADGGTIPNGSKVPLGTSVYDTAQFYGDIVNDDEERTASVDGTLTYTLYRGADCSGESTLVDSWDMTVTADKPVPPMLEHFFVDVAGTYNFQATFVSGDTTITSPCGTERFVVDPLEVSLTTTIHVDGGAIDDGSRVHGAISVADGVTLNYTQLDGIDAPSGTVTYELYNSANCDGDRIFQNSKPVVDGAAVNSDEHPLAADHYGVYNWVVTFESDDPNYSDGLSDCQKETFYKDVQPTLTTDMFTSPDGESDIVELPNGNGDVEVTVGDFVKDTATLGDHMTENPGGTVTFTLHQGSTCEGPAMFTPAPVPVVNGKAETPWYQIRIHGAYSWSAHYSGDNTTGGYNLPADSDCSTETFTAAPDTVNTPSMVTVMRNGDTIIGNGTYIARPATVTDEAVFTNVSEKTTGTVTYELYANEDGSGTPIETWTVDVENGIAPLSPSYTIPEIPSDIDSRVYSWVVTANLDDPAVDGPITLYSGAKDEQFRIFEDIEYGGNGICTYNTGDDTMSATIWLTPRNVANVGDPVKITFSPYARDLAPLTPIVEDGTTQYVWTFDHKEWRELEVRADWPNGSWARFNLRCLQSSYSPEITTEMYVAGDPAIVLNNGSAVEPGTTIFDTTAVEEDTSTVIMTGTLKYELFRGPVCEIENSTLVNTTTRQLNRTPIGDLPASNEVTVTEPGSYFWVVTYTPPASQGRFPDNNTAVSDCETESFIVLDLIVPVNPTVSGNVCTGGGYTPPTVALADGPEGVIYEVTQDVDENGDYVVIATLSDGQAWGDLDSTDWLPVEGDASKARYEGHVELAPCDEIEPVNPTVSGNVCEGGTYTDPEVVVADGPEGVSYAVTQDVDENGDYVVIATLSDGQEWGDDSETWPTGWTVNPDNAAEAIYNGHVELQPCDEIEPITPDVTAGVCTGGVWTPPSVGTSDEREFIEYDVDLNEETGDYTVTATITEGGYAWQVDENGQTPNGWTVNPETPTIATLTGEVAPNPCDEIVPLNPTVSGNVCEGGAYTDPQIDLPTTPEGVSYEVAQDGDENGDYVVTATLSDGQAWAEDLGDWTRTSDTVATYEGHEDLTPCDPVLPIQPEVTQVVCTGSELTDPVVSTTDTEAITYAFNEDDVVNGGTVEITATLADGYEWDTDANDWPEGWTVVEDNPAQATRIVELDEVSCTPVTPVNPTVTNTVCTGGELTEPTVTPAETDGIEYTTEGDVVNGGTVIVIATLEDGYGWPEVLPAGWTDNEDGTASFTVELDDVSCDPVTPIIPEVTQAVCEGGELIPPTITPVETEGIEYTFDEGQVAPGATVIVTATVQDGYGWPETLPDGWERVNSETATTEVNLEDVECEEVIPAAPVVENAVCTEGALTEPTVTLQETNGIEYTTEGDVVNGGTVIVTATVQDGYAWAETLPAGWTKVDSETATYTVELDEVNCTPVTPVAPTVNNAVCTGGALTEPTVTPAETEGIKYTFDQDDVINGGTVVITATVEDGYGWPETLPAGWTKVDDATATWTVELDEVSCTPVTPETPETTQPVCTEGVVQDGFVTVPPTEGVEYTIEGDIVPGGTVVITGTVQDGYAWPSELPGGWTKIDDATVTYTIQLDEVECTEVDPGLPVITQPVCTEDGTVQDPTISLPETPGVDYTIEGELVPGGTVVITATLKDGYAWPVDILEGWTRVDDTTMTFSVTFDTVDCETPADPSDPEDPAATPEPGSPVETLPSTGSGGAALSPTGMAVLLLATMAAITAAVAAWLRREGAR